MEICVNNRKVYLLNIFKISKLSRTQVCFNVVVNFQKHNTM